MIASTKNHTTALRIAAVDVTFSRALRKFQVKLKMMTMSVLVIMMHSYQIQMIVMIAAKSTSSVEAAVTAMSRSVGLNFSMTVSSRVHAKTCVTAMNTAMTMIGNFGESRNISMGLLLFEIVDVSDDALDLGVEKLFVSLIEFGDSDAFLLADVELSLECVVFCLGYGCIERCGVVVG